PIIFAIAVLASDIPNARMIFNIVFFCTLVSLVVQGTSLARMAQWLGIAEQPNDIKGLENFDLEFSDEIKSVPSEVRITSQSLTNGNMVMNLGWPEKTIAVMVKRDDKYFV